MKIKLKDILTLTLTNAKKEVKSLTDPQIVKLLDKLDKLFVIVETYSDSKFAKSMEDKLDEELDEELENSLDDEVQEESGEVSEC